MTAPPDTQAAIALNRHGLGARPDEPQPPDPKAWLLAQFERYEPLPPAWDGLPGSAPLAVAYTDYQRELRQASAADEPALRQKLNRFSQETYRAAVNARVASALVTPAPFAERLVHFWANHFAVSIEKPPLAALAGAFEVEAIRPHVFGRFEDMLVAVERHPAMLLYLDQARSTGPGSTLGRRAARNNPERLRGLNENLAREIMELHTLGVRSGYNQEDVTELARALTGWSVGGLPGLPAAGTPGAFVFQPLMHESGARSVLGKGYERSGEAQASAILHDLAVAPATARHIAMKLARHFAGDTPAPALVERLAGTFLRSRGHLPAVYRALLDAPEAWDPAPAKFKTPWEWALSSLRGLGLRCGSARLACCLWLATNAAVVSIADRSARVARSRAGGRPGLGSGSRPARPRRAKRARQCSTVLRATPSRAAIATLVSPSSASRRMRARCFCAVDILFFCATPALSVSLSCGRSRMPCFGGRDCCSTIFGRSSSRMRSRCAWTIRHRSMCAMDWAAAIWS